VCELRDLRADHAAAASATARRKDSAARQTAQAIVAAHGPHLITAPRPTPQQTPRLHLGTSTDQANKHKPNVSTVRTSRLMNQLLVKQPRQSGGPRPNGPVH